MHADESRRQFLIQSMTGVSAAFMAANWPAIARAQEQAAAGESSFAFFTPAEAAMADAMASQIFPTTDTPGAKEAHAVLFIDLALVSFAKDQQALVRQGLAGLAAQNPDFATLPSDRQVAILTGIETTPFFHAMRNLTIMGMFAAPQHGGNFDKLGWKLIGFDDSLNFTAPFGAYDKA